MVLLQVLWVERAYFQQPILAPALEDIVELVERVGMVGVLETIAVIAMFAPAPAL